MSLGQVRWKGVILLEKLLVVGASGLLGSKVFSLAGGKYDTRGTCNPEADGCPSLRLDEMDIGSKEDVDRIFDKLRPDIVILTAAMTNVDACERTPSLANRVNASGPGLVARACRRTGARLIHLSTDYVFDGMKTRGYTEGDVPRPISVYGSSKLAGEKAVMNELEGAIVARTAVLYGWNNLEGKDCFVSWVLRKLRGKEKATLFKDQRISPTFADDLAAALLGLAQRNVSGLYHVAGPDCLDRPACGRLIAQVFGLDENLVIPVESQSVSLPARRPKYSCLDSSKLEKLLNRKMVSFEDGLRTMKEQELRKR